MFHLHLYYNKIIMFNPQRKSKVNDIYMQQRAYQIHLKKMMKIDNTLSSSKRYEEQSGDSQQRYLTRIAKSKQQVKDRITTSIKKENTRLLEQLIKTEQRKEANPELQLKKKHFNSFFTGKKESQRIRSQNFTMLVRMAQPKSDIPTLRSLKKQFKKNKKMCKKCRKLPSIVKYQKQFRTKLSIPMYQSRTTSMRSLSRKSSSLRNIQKFEKDLLQ